jgi:hypothetical protein
LQGIDYNLVDYFPADPSLAINRAGFSKAVRKSSTAKSFCLKNGAIY